MANRIKAEGLNWDHSIISITYITLGKFIVQKGILEKLLPKEYENARSFLGKTIYKDYNGF